MASSRKAAVAAPAAPTGKAPERPPLYVVTPAVGKPWTGEVIDPRDSEMGWVQLSAALDALDDDADPNKYVIVRCMRNGGNAGLEEGMDYLVLSRFVHKM